MSTARVSGGAFRVGTLLGIPIRIHFTFLLLLLWFGNVSSDQGEGFLGGVVFMLLLFGCVVLHELGHALAARRFGVATREIVLYPFGGVARIDRMPSGKAELVIAPAGPAVNLVLAALLGGVLSALRAHAPDSAEEVIADAPVHGSGTPLRVEAASYRGRPVSFFVRGPWQRALREDPGLSGARQVPTIVSVLLMVGSILAAIVFARRNVRAGRSDRRGAARLALFKLGVGTASFLLRSQFPRTVDLAGGGFTGAVEIALFVAALIWLLYLALEPLIRRGGPQALVAWNRVLAGRWRDPLVGRDLLVGCAYGAIMLALAGCSTSCPPDSHCIWNYKRL